MSNAIEFYRGDYYSAEVTVADEDGTVVDITGATATLSVIRRGVSGYTMQVEGTIAVGTDGVVAFEIESGDTENLTAGTYHYDVQVTLASGNIHTVVVDTLTLLPDITGTR